MLLKKQNFGAKFLERFSRKFTKSKGNQGRTVAKKQTKKSIQQCPFALNTQQGNSSRKKQQMIMCNVIVLRIRHQTWAHKLFTPA